jgi:Protein of unknown function (DUF402)
MWTEGQVVIRREVLNDGRPWLEVPVIVVRDTAELLATFIAEGAPFRFPPGSWPAPHGRHPWHGKEHWHGHGVLMLQRPGEAHAIWLFWRGPRRTFAGWYVNIQEPFRRTGVGYDPAGSDTQGYDTQGCDTQRYDTQGYDTQDLELDIWIPLDRAWEWKDEELLARRVEEGRFTAEQVVEIRAEGARIAAELDAGRRWWDESWAGWQPDPAWPTPSFDD